MNAGIRELLRFIAVVGVAIALLLGALLLNGCAGAVEVRRPTPRQESAARVLRGASGLVALSTVLCPGELDACSKVRRWGGVLSDGLAATASVLEVGRPVDRALCLAPVVGSFLDALQEVQVKVPADLGLYLDRALEWLPDCPGPPVVDNHLAQLSSLNTPKQIVIFEQPTHVPH